MSILEIEQICMIVCMCANVYVRRGLEECLGEKWWWGSRFIKKYQFYGDLWFPPGEPFSLTHNTNFMTKKYYNLRQKKEENALKF